MTEQLNFVIDLRRELDAGADRLAKRRSRARQATLAVAVMGMAIAGGLLIGQFNDERDNSTNQVATVTDDEASDNQSSDTNDSDNEPIDGRPTGGRDEGALAPTGIFEEATTELAGPASTEGDLSHYDLRLSSGERFRLTAPNNILTGPLTVSEPASRGPVVIDGADAGIELSFGSCPDPVDETGIVCKPDELLTMGVTTSGGSIAAADLMRLELRTLATGTRYGPVLAAAYPEYRSCGNCVPWGPMVYETEGIAVHRTADGAIEAIDRTTLAGVWRTTLPPGSEQPRLFAEPTTLLVDVVGGPVIKLDLDGGEVWRLEREAGEDRLDVFGRFLLTSFTDQDDNRAPLIRRVDEDTGAVVWTVTGRIGADWQTSSPVLMGNTMVVMDVLDTGMTGPIATLQAFDVTTGELEWTTELGGTRRTLDYQLLERAEIEEGWLLLARTDAAVFRVDPLTGEITWQVDAPVVRFAGTEFSADGTLGIDVEIELGRRLLLDPASGATMAWGGNGEPFVCPVTVPTQPGLTPPEPWPAEPSSSDNVWYGTDDLWTVMYTSGHLPRKSVWWSANFPGGSIEEQPELTVAYERLDPGAAPDDNVVFESPGTNAFTPADGDFMINGLEPDEPGCWQATATYKGATLSYVYSID